MAWRDDGKWQDIAAYYVNLDHRKDRRAHMEAELAKAGITATRTRGLPTVELLRDSGGAMPRCQRMLKRTPGAVGCHFSQVRCMIEARAEGKHAMIFEDDCVFCCDFLERLALIENFLDNIPGGDFCPWDVFWLGGTVHLDKPEWHCHGHNSELTDCKCGLNRDWERTENPRFIRTYGAFSTYAYIVNARSLDKVLYLLDQNLHRSIGIDFLFIALQPQLRTFMFLPGCVKQYDNESDIGKGMTMFSGFEKLGPHWFQDKMEQYNPGHSK